MTKYRNNWLNLPIWVVFTVIALLIKTGKRLTGLGNRASYKSVDQMTGLEFEHEVARLLRENGYSKIRFTEKYDYGIDLIAAKDNVIWGVQVKRRNSLVKADAVRQVVTGLKKYKCDRAMIVTNNFLSKYAMELAKSNGCLVIDRNGLKRLQRY